MNFESNPQDRFQETFKNFERYLEEYKPIKTPNELREMCSDNETLKKILDDMFKYCARYAQDVWEMNELLKKEEFDAEKFDEIDKKRTILHNSAMDSINIFSRALKKFGKDNSWIRDIVGSRASYAKFAIGTALMLADEEYKILEGKRKGGEQDE